MSETGIAFPATLTRRPMEILIVLGGCFLPLIALAIYWLASGSREATHDTTGTLISIGFELIVGLAALWFLARRRFPLRRFRLRLRPDLLFTGSVLGMVMVGASTMIHWFFLAIIPRADEIGVSSIRNTAPVALMLAYLIWNSFFEEAFVLAYPVTAFENAGAWPVVLGSAALRASYHIYQGPAAAATVFVEGLFLGAIYWRSRDLTIPFVVHTVVNVILM